ncbi:MAG: hypothetical protein AAGI30_03640 [Planctomycetota bacterium]
MTRPLFAHPDLPSFGLGNLLIPWARAEVFRRTHEGCGMLAARWTQPKIGPILRLERDWRFYHNLFDRRDAIGSSRKRAILAAAERFGHTDAEGALEAARGAGDRPVVVDFRFPEWGDNFFDGDAPASRRIIFDGLMGMLSAGTRRTLERAHTGWAKDPYIAVHVRRGDKKVIPDGERKDVYRESIWVMNEQWYVSALRSVRSVVGEDLRAVVFSDGKDHEIAHVLGEPNVERAPRNNAVADILLLAGGHALIGTGNSSFSLWAGLLSERPSVWFPTLGKQMYPERPEMIVETTPEGGLDEGGRERLVAALAT